MKYLVNGESTDLSPDPGVHITRQGDRWLVRDASGTYTALAIKLGSKTVISARGQVFEIEEEGQRREKAGGGAAQGTFLAPMPGQITDVFVAQGDPVTKGQRLLVLEAMKTQQPVIAPFDGVVAELPVSKGQQVAEGVVLVKVEPKT